MPASNDCDQEPAATAMSNPYAAPQARLVESERRYSQRDLLRRVAFRRRGLFVLGGVRFLGGIVSGVCGAALLENATFFFVILFGLYNCLCGIGLARCRDWGRKLTTLECLIQIALAIALMAFGADDYAGDGRVLVLSGLIPLVWNSAYLRILISPLTASACQDTKPSSDALEEHGEKNTAMGFLSMTFGLLGVVAFATIGVMISVILILLAQPGYLP